MSAAKPLAWPVVSYISWMLNLSEDKAVEIVKLMQEWEAVVPERFAPVFEKCESPAERLFLTGFFLVGAGCFNARVANHALEFDLGEPQTGSEGRLRIIPQWEIYDTQTESNDPAQRCDFCVIYWPDSQPGSSVNIEIDGHDFHERTKEQASSDRKRDRVALRSDGPVIRFTGSNVYAGPQACVSDTISILRALSERREMNECQLSSEAYRRGFEAGFTARGVSLVRLGQQVQEVEPADAKTLLGEHGIRLIGGKNPRIESDFPIEDQRGLPRELKAAVLHAAEGAAE
jgi:hypothetical protein